MYIKIYFNDKPLFLCDEMTDEIKGYAHHDDAVLIDEYSHPAVNAMIHEMRRESVHAGIFLHSDLGALKRAFWKKFMLVRAGGGLVRNENAQYLFMLRRGKWDLPKGKRDKGENMEECALREVKEETGLKTLAITEKICDTYHIYAQYGEQMLKCTTWYKMKASSADKLKPQKEENIMEARWVNAQDLAPLVARTYEAIREVLRLAGEQF